MEKLHTLAAKNLDKFTEQEKIDYYNEVCKVLNLDPVKRPFEYFFVEREYEGRHLILYVTKAGGNQLRDVNNISIKPVSVKIEGGVIVATAEAVMPNGRTDSDVGSVPAEGLKGKDLSNAVMSATTKAKRRVTISILGLGFLDETEVQDLSGTIERVTPTQAPDLKPVLDHVSVAIPTEAQVVLADPKATPEAIAKIGRAHV